MNSPVITVICNKDGTTTVAVQNGSTRILQPGDMATVNMDVFFTS